jgi:hypothetical protein
MSERFGSLTQNDLRSALEAVRGRLAALGAPGVEFREPTIGTDSTGERTVGVVAVVADDLAGRPRAADLMLDILDVMRREFDERGIAAWPYVNVVRQSDVHEFDQAG